MVHPYKTRAGGATVTVFVPYDCCNNCPFCINKEEYADTSGFSLEKICESIRVMDAFTPMCDFVFTGGEPLANLDALQVMLDCVSDTHRIFINTTLPVLQNHTEAEVLAFFARNRHKLTCINVSRHLFHYVEEGDDAIFGRMPVRSRINCVLFGAHSPERLIPFIKRFGKYNVPIQLRADDTKTTPENLYDETSDGILADLRSILTPTLLEGCRVRCNYEFLDGKHVISYHKTLPYSTIVETGDDGVTYDILYDIVIKQNGDLHSDWTGVLLDVERYWNVVFEPSDLHRIS